jgi:hypothetical protein
MSDSQDGPRSDKRINESRAVELSASGQVVSAITLDSNIVLFAGHERQYQFRIETDLTLSIAGTSVIVHYAAYAGTANVPRNIDALAALVRSRILRAEAASNGLLTLTFDGPEARAITVKPDGRFEAWTYSHGEYVLSCPPGGDLDPLPDEAP